MSRFLPQAARSMAVRAGLPCTLRRRLTEAPLLTSSKASSSLPIAAADINGVICLVFRRSNPLSFGMFLAASHAVLHNCS